MAITRLSGGTSPANGSDPRTFPAIWNDAVDDIEAAEAAIGVIEANDWVTTARIDDGAVTAPKLAKTAGAVMVFDDDAARTTAIPTPSEGMVTYLKDTNAVEKYDGAAFVSVSPPDGFTAGTAIIATDASWPVPTLASPIVKVTVVGGGGGGGGSNAGDGGTGGTTTFNAGGAGSISAGGGLGGRNGGANSSGNVGTAGTSAGNGGQGAVRQANGLTACGGNGGGLSVGYLNLTGISTVNVTIGNGGAGGSSTINGANGGRGEVIVEYVAG